MKKTLLTSFLIVSCLVASAQSRALSLEDCRHMALESNKALKLSQEKVGETEAMKQLAFCEMLPRLTANGTYNYNQKSIQLLSSEQQNRINNIGTAVNQQFSPSMVSLITQLMQTDPTVAQALMGMLSQSNLEGNLNALGQQITDDLNMDLTHVFAGSITVAQPIYMGGKLRELYRTASAANEIAQLAYDKEREDLLIQVDEAYWRVLSVMQKQQLAEQYVQLLDTMYRNVMALKEAEMGTEADVTKVRVKLNEAQMSLAKANSGLALSRMVLFQMCGLDLNGDYVLDEQVDLMAHPSMEHIDMDMVLANRYEMKMLHLSDTMSQSAVKIARAGLLPNIVAQGSYVVTNPNLYDGFQKEFGGMMTAGVVVNVPIAHPAAICSLKAAKHKRNEVIYQMEEAEEMITLQVNKLNYELGVANTKMTQAESNLVNAEENLKAAQESFSNGMISLSDLMAAQTAWLSANSERLDAAIEVKMNALYLNQALGK